MYFIFKNTQQNHVLLIICAATIITYVSSNKQFIKLKPKYDISYGVYLWGFLIQQTIYYYLGHLYTVVHCLIAIFFSVLFGILSYVLIEKPFMLYGKKTFNKYNKTNFINVCLNILQKK